LTLTFLPNEGFFIQTVSRIFMKIINPLMQEDIRNNRPLLLNFGSGGKIREGYYGVDLLALPGVDAQADLNKPLDLILDNSVISVTSQHTFEHISNLFGLMGELHRIVRPDGNITITVPHFSNAGGYSDPTHVRFFGLYTMLYFADDHKFRRHVPNFYTDLRFVIESIRIKFARAGFDRLLGGLKDHWVNVNERTQACYERHFCWISPAEEIVYVIKPKK
jgi:hypothetical protein